MTNRNIPSWAIHIWRHYHDTFTPLIIDSNNPISIDSATQFLDLLMVFLKVADEKSKNFLYKHRLQLTHHHNLTVEWNTLVFENVTTDSSPKLQLKITNNDRSEIVNGVSTQGESNEDVKILEPVDTSLADSGLLNIIKRIFVVLYPPKDLEDQQDEQKFQLFVLHLSKVYNKFWTHIFSNSNNLSFDNQPNNITNDLLTVINSWQSSYSKSKDILPLISAQPYISGIENVLDRVSRQTETSPSPKLTNLSHVSFPYNTSASVSSFIEPSHNFIQFNLYPLFGKLEVELPKYEPKHSNVRVTPQIHADNNERFYIVQGDANKIGELKSLLPEICQSAIFKSMDNIEKKNIDSVMNLFQTVFDDSLQFSFYVDGKNSPSELIVKLKYPGSNGVDSLLELSPKDYSNINSDTKIYFTQFKPAEKGEPLLWKAAYYLHQHPKIIALGSVYLFLKLIGVEKSIRHKIFDLLKQVQDMAKKKLIAPRKSRFWSSH